MYLQVEQEWIGVILMDNVPDAPDCQIDGYDDGQNGPFDQDMKNASLT